MQKQTEETVAAEPVKRSYHEPLLIRHEPLRNITGALKSGEKPIGDEKPTLNEKGGLDEA